MNDKNTRNRAFLVILTIGLWLLSALIAFLLILPVLDSFITIYAAFWADTNIGGSAYYLGTTIRQIGVMVLVIFFVIGIIGGIEHYTHHFNSPSSWEFMFITFAIELTLLLFSVLI